MPTFCSLAGATTPKDFQLNGEDMSTVLRGDARRRAIYGNPRQRSPLFWEYGRNNQSFAYPQGRDRSPNLAMRDVEWKLLINADGGGAELYNLHQDPSESKNLAAEEPGVTERMTSSLLNWRKSLPRSP